jgi:hypothetical protein
VENTGIRVLLDRPDRRSGPRHDQIDLQTNQVLCEGGESVDPSVCRPVLDGDALALDPAEILQGLEEGGISVACRAVVEVPDERRLSRRLRLGGERRGEEAQGARDEGAPIHH